MSGFAGQVVRVLSLLAAVLCVPVAGAQGVGPDALIRDISRDVFAAIKQDAGIRAGNSKRLVELVESMVLPHVDAVRMTRLAVGAGWRAATPEQQLRLTEEFTTLLVHTYSAAVLTYSDQLMEVKPTRAQPGETEIIVRSEVRQPGMQPIAFDFTMERTPAGWKVYDVKIAGVSLVTTYRATFQEEIRNRGIEGLIALLANKNRQNGKRLAPIQSARPNPAGPV